MPALGEPGARPAGRGCRAPPSASRPRPLTSTATASPRPVRQVGEDRVDQLVGDPVGRSRAARAGRPARRGCPSRSPSGRRAARRSGAPAAGMVHGESATPIVRSPSAARVVTATTSSSERRPRRPLRRRPCTGRRSRRSRAGALARSGGAEATSSAPRTVADLDALGAGQLRREVEVHHVAAVVAVEVQHAGARRRPPRVTSSIWSALGEANTSPIAAPSISPAPDVAHEHRQVARAAAGRDARPCPRRARRPGRSPRGSTGARARPGAPRGCPRASRRRTRSGSLRIFCIGPPPDDAGRRPRYSALTAAISAARPSFASAKSIPVFGFV